MNILLLATAWGPRYGGINAFNQDFALGLGNIIKGTRRVFCAVPSARATDVAEAMKDGVTLIPIPEASESGDFKDAWIYAIAHCLKNQHGNPDDLVWVGHDVVTGFAARKGAELTGGTPALLMHMSY